MEQEWKIFIGIFSQPMENKDFLCRKKMDQKRHQVLIRIYLYILKNTLSILLDEKDFKEHYTME